jgi:multiple sugar transport system substrate-binding protein
MRRLSRPIYRGLTALSLVSMMLVAGGGVQASTVHHPTQATMTLRIAWFKWPPGDALQVLGNYYHTTHPNITIKVDEVPAGQWATFQFTQFAAHHTSFQMNVGDSQWLGEEATNHWDLDLTSWIKSNLNVNDYNPYLFASYGQYPQRKPGTTGGVDLVHGHFYGVPFESDALAFAYRKDLFNNPANRRAFKAKYGFALGVPKSWTQLMDEAAFFTRPAQHLWGIGVHQASTYDAAAEYFDQILWNWGGELWNANTGQIQGVVNDFHGVSALNFAKQLAHYAPPGSGNWWFDDVTSAFNQGEIAIANNWWGFLPSLLDPSKSKLGTSRAQLINQKVGFFIPPGQTFQGKYHHWVALGGQGMSISAFDSPAQIKASEDFIKWSQSFPIQARWIRLGGGPTTKTALNSKIFHQAEPFAGLEAQSYKLVKDFWNVPDYANMLDIQGRDLNAALTGGKSVTDALNDMAAKQQHFLCQGVRLGREPKWSYCLSHPGAF